MDDPAPPPLVDAILTLLQELVVGPPDPPMTWVASNEPESGLLGTVAKLSAADASRRLPRHAHTIAAHVEHVRFALNAGVRWLTEPQPPDLDWASSWAVQEVDDAAWTKLRADLAQEHDRLRQALRNARLSGPDLIGSVAAPAHVAYHLGAVRQMIALLPQ